MDEPCPITSTFTPRQSDNIESGYFYNLAVSLNYLDEANVKTPPLLPKVVQQNLKTSAGNKLDPSDYTWVNLPDHIKLFFRFDCRDPRCTAFCDHLWQLYNYMQLSILDPAASGRLTKGNALASKYNLPLSIPYLLDGIADCLVYGTEQSGNDIIRYATLNVSKKLTQIRLQFADSTFRTQEFKVSLQNFTVVITQSFTYNAITPRFHFDPVDGTLLLTFKTLKQYFHFQFGLQPCPPTLPKAPNFEGMKTVLASKQQSTVESTPGTKALSGCVEGEVWRQQNMLDPVFSSYKPAPNPPPSPTPPSTSEASYSPRSPSPDPRNGITQPDPPSNPEQCSTLSGSSNPQQPSNPQQVSTSPSPYHGPHRCACQCLKTLTKRMKMQTMRQRRVEAHLKNVLKNQEALLKKMAPPKSNTSFKKSLLQRATKESVVSDISE